MKKLKKIVSLLFVLCLVVGNLSSCLIGPSKKMEKLFYSPNSCWKADEIDMILYFPDSSELEVDPITYWPYTKDYGLGHYKDAILGYNYYFNGLLTWNDVEYYLIADLNPEQLYEIYITVYSDNFSNSYIDGFRLTVKSIYDENSFAAEIMDPTSINLPSKMKITFHRIIEE